MKPSDFAVRSFPPFVGTFTKTEIEALMALLYCFLLDKGDEFRPVFAAELNTYLREQIDRKKGLVYEIMTNPFLPALEQVDRAIKLGFLGWSGTAKQIADRKAGLVFTELSLDRLKQKWLRNATVYPKLPS